ncbi:MAG: hypothetical protein IJZ42_05850 [Lachnospiraceae bacterium]|nr:hypothetical protein [Lachnospiraceae bacterium]
MNYKKANSVSNYMFIFAMAFMGGSLLIQNAIIAMTCLIIAVGLIIAAIVVRIKYWRCPHCKKMLSLGFSMEPKNCPKCRGYLLDDDKK